MDLDLQIEGADDLKSRLTAALDRLGELQAGTRVSSDGFFSRPFMREHTEFDSFGTFCDQSPWSFDTTNDIQDVPCHRLNEYVARTTDFDSWEGMKTQAAEEEIIDQIIS